MRAPFFSVVGIPTYHEACRPPAPDPWKLERRRAWLDSRGGELPFILELHERFESLAQLLPAETHAPS